MKGIEVKEWRIKAGLSRMELSRRTGVSYFSIVKWECGSTNPSRMAQDRLDLLIAEMKGKEDQNE